MKALCLRCQRLRALEPKRSVYFALHRPSGLVKIGFSKNIARRMVDLRRFYVAGAVVGRVELMGTVPGGVLLERELKAALRSRRVEGEWFRLSQRHVRSLLRRYSPKD